MIINAIATRRVHMNCIRWRSVYVTSLLLILMLGIAGCGFSLPREAANTNTVGSTVAYSEFPQEIGRGFPVVKVESKLPPGVQIRAGEAAPDFALALDDGREINLSDLRGSPVMLNFWATWCPPCRAEMPEIVRAAEADEDLVVIAVNVQEAVKQVRSFAEEYEMQMPVARDINGKLRDLYQVRGMPTSIFIDRDGNISSTWAGGLNAEQLETELDRIR